MFVVLVYDIEVERVAKVLKIARRYLGHIQNSVFEGELTPAQFRSLRTAICAVIEPERDSVRYYVHRSTTYLEIVQDGTARRETGNML